MNTKELIRLGVPLGEAQRRAVDFVSKFILAGGAPAGAALHVARTVCRRAERRMVALEPAVDGVLIRYVNRLSDLLFVLARVVNHRGGVRETEW